MSEFGYSWFVNARVNSNDWTPAHLTDFPWRGGQKVKLRYRVLTQYQDAYDVSIDEAALTLRKLLDDADTAFAHRYSDEWWFIEKADEAGVTHRFLADNTGTITAYAPPSWERRMGIPVPMGEVIPMQEFRNIDVNNIVATRNTIKRCYSKIAPEVRGLRTRGKMEHLRKTLAMALSDPKSEILHKPENPNAYIVISPDRNVLWVMRVDGRYLLRIFTQEHTNIYNSILGG